MLSHLSVQSQSPLMQIIQASCSTAQVNWLKLLLPLSNYYVSDFFEANIINCFGSKLEYSKMEYIYYILCLL